MTRSALLISTGMYRDGPVPASHQLGKGVALTELAPHDQQLIAHLPSFACSVGADARKVHGVEQIFRMPSSSAIAVSGMPLTPLPSEASTGMEPRHQLRPPPRAPEKASQFGARSARPRHSTWPAQLTA